MLWQLGQMTSDPELQTEDGMLISFGKMFCCWWFPQCQAPKTMTLHPLHTTQVFVSTHSIYNFSSYFIHFDLFIIPYKRKNQKKKKKEEKMKKINLILRKCKSLSRQLGRSSSYSSLRSKSNRENVWGEMHEEEQREAILVGSSRRRYMINSKYLNHPLLIALIDKSKQSPGEALLIKCEVVLFDHLLWMLENGEPNLSSESLEELAELYVL